ncbi:fimbrial protein [Pantoea sp. USHLN256]|uniref:fimbrial protein n=1 Tax=Pantoea sp. USHLN256 TaxID=3081293 RepID=UPI003018369A
MRKLMMVLPLLALPATSFAADTVTLNVSGSLHLPTVCNVVPTSTTIAFGDILSSRINGTTYAQPLGVSVSCTNRNPLNSVNVQVTGTGTTTNKLPVTGSTVKGMVLALKRGTAVQNFGTNIPMTTDGSLNLSLTPEVKAGEAFVAGPFTASLTVRVTVT